jgi:hypothetical protein
VSSGTGGVHGDRHRVGVDVGDGGAGAVDDLSPAAVLVERHDPVADPELLAAITIPSARTSPFWMRMVWAAAFRAATSVRW